MRGAGLEAVDLWIGSGASAIAPLVLPVLSPKYFIPVHWDGLYSPFLKGVPRRTPESTAGRTTARGRRDVVDTFCNTWTSG